MLDVKDVRRAFGPEGRVGLVEDTVVGVLGFAGLALAPTLMLYGIAAILFVAAPDRSRL